MKDKFKVFAQRGGLEVSAGRVARASLACGALLAAASILPVTPLQAATAIATVDANVVSTISIAVLNGLGFGEISSSAVAGTVVMTPSGSRSTSGGVTVNSAVAGSAASFDISGNANATYAITLPASVVLTDPASNSMVVDGFTSTPSTTGTLDGSGQQTLYVGATLNVGSNQPLGGYSGLMSVSVEYN